jgi:RNA polymerase sigma factor (sigma-70 family)
MANKADAEDIAQEAFLKVTAAMERGNGPEAMFRPYLLRAIRTAAADRWNEQVKETPTDNTGDTPVEDASLAALLHRDDPELVMKAFQSLPHRWMTVLWHAEVEREPPRRIAPILGIEPGAVSALLLRARKGLREAYLNAYASAPPRSECEPTFPYLAATVLGTSSARDRRKVKEHTRDCEDCAKVMAELTDVGATMRGILAPLLLIPSGVILPGGKQLLLPDSGTSFFGAGLTAAAVTVTIAAVAAVGSLAVTGDTMAVPAATPSHSTATQAAPEQSLPYSGTTTTPAPTLSQNPVAAEQPIFPGSYPPPETFVTEPVGAGNSPGRAAQFAASDASLPPAGAAGAGALHSTAPTAPTGTALSTPTAAPTQTSRPTPTPTTTQTPAPSPTPTPVPTEPGCFVVLIVCVGG